MAQNPQGSGKNEPTPGIIRTLLLAPLNISLAMASATFASLRPYAPKLIPLVVFSSFIPLLAFLSTCAGLLVWSTLSVSWEKPLYLQYGDGGNPYAYVHLPTLTSSQRYDLSVELVLPSTDANLALGNFMTALTLSTATGNKTLAHIRRPAIASPPDASFNFNIFSPRTHRRVKIPLIEAFVAPKSRLAAFVEIGRQDRWTSIGAGQAREVSVAAAKLQGLVVPHGIRGIAIRFPLLASLASGALFFAILSLILAIFVLPLVLPDIPDGDEDDVDDGRPPPQKKPVIKTEPQRRDASPASSSSGPVSRRPSAENISSRRKRRSRSAKSEGDDAHIPVKSELSDNEETLLSATGERSSNRGLRRRTSRPVVESHSRSSST